MNYCLKYRGYLASGVYFSTAVCAPSIKSFTACCSRVTDIISGSRLIDVCTIFPIFSSLLARMIRSVSRIMHCGGASSEAIAEGQILSLIVSLWNNYSWN